MRSYRALWGIALAILLVATGGSLLAQSSAAGALVSAVATGGPAEKAGIARGDIILAVDDREVAAPRDVVEAVGAHKSGESVTLKVSHGDTTRTVSVTLDARDDRPYLGIMLAPAVAEGGPRRGTQDDAPAPFAALIAEVAQGSPAAQAGLRPRDVVLAVDGASLDSEHSLTDLVARHKPGDAVTLSVASQGAQPRDVKVTLGRNPSGADSAYLGVRYGTVSSRGDGRPPRMRSPRPEGGGGPVTS